MIAIIRCETLGAAKESLYACAFQGRHSLHRLFEHRLEVIEVPGQFIEGEVLGNTVTTPGFGDRFKGTQQNLPGVFFVIRASIVVSKNGQCGFHSGEGFREEIEMFASVHGHDNAHTSSQFPSPHTCREHYLMSLDLTLIRLDPGHSCAIVTNAGYFDVFKNARPPKSRPTRQRLSYIDGVDLSV